MFMYQSLENNHFHFLTGFTSKRHDPGGQKDDREDEMVFEETGISVGERKASLASESSGNWEGTLH